MRSAQFTIQPENICNHNQEYENSQQLLLFAKHAEETSLVGYQAPRTLT